MGSVFHSFSGRLQGNVNYAIKGLVLSVGLTTLVTLIATATLGVIWLENQANSDSLMFNRIDSLSMLVSISELSTTDLAQALVIFSSRDSQMLQSLFVGLSLLNYITALVFIVVLMLRPSLKLRDIILVSLMLLSSFILELNSLPKQLSSHYLLLSTGLSLLSLTAYILLKRSAVKLLIAKSASTLIAYASQSGTAHKIAENMAKSAQGCCDIQAFSQISPQSLTAYRQLLIVASTYGDGQGPEKSLGFVYSLEQYQERFSHLSFAVLALGDSAYPKFCAFGHHIAELLTIKGATILQPVQEVDRADPTIVGQWWQQVAQLLGWKSDGLSQHWLTANIVSNQCLNEQRTQRPAHAISLKVSGVKYQAGDLLEILTPTPLVDIDQRLLQLGLAPQTLVRFDGELIQLNLALTKCEWTVQVANSPQALVDKLPRLAPRVYSIASAPNDNVVRLLVRQLVKEDDSLGFCSSRLCSAAIDSQFDVAIRPHNSFRLPSSETPIIMICAGTGIAPFMSFLAQRQQQSAGESWLIFGEQYSSHDNYFNLELDEYLDNGVLTQLDCAFSRDNHWLDAGGARYVDEVLVRQLAMLGQWLHHKEAHLYVCGSKRGMGESVKSTLKELLGEKYQWLEESHRLHFDLY